MAATSCDKSFANSHLLLRPEDVSLKDLFCILFSANLEPRKFVDSSHDKEESFNQRWVIFMSIIVQKLLLLMAMPMWWFGSSMEFWLNLVRINGGSLTSLLLKLLRGRKVVWPDRESADFLSLIGNLDRRMYFDKNIRPGDEIYYAHLALMCSKASYENDAFIRSIVTSVWKMEYFGFHDFWNDYQEKATTQGFILRDKSDLHGDMIVVAFRGTEPFDADSWCSDLDISWYGLDGMGRMHGGFMKALGLQRNTGWPKEIPSESDDPSTPHPSRTPTAYYFIREKLRALLAENSRSRYILTGHSLGGALAILFPAILSLHGENELLNRLEGVYTFGQPRVGDGDFGKFMQKVLNDHKIEYHRFVYSNDIVPRLPYDNSTFLFKHFGKCRYFDSHYGEQILPEEPNKNYFSLRNAIPMMKTAAYELMRSFTIESMKGPEYGENTLLIILRVAGLLVPGVPAHSLMDYNNSIRLGLALCRDVSIKYKDN